MHVKDKWDDGSTNLFLSMLYEYLIGHSNKILLFKCNYYQTWP